MQLRMATKMVQTRKKDEELPARYWGPGGMMHDMQLMFDDMRHEFDLPWRGPMGIFGSRFPAVDIKDEGDKYLVEADLPGVTKENVTIEIGGGILHIAAEQKTEIEEKEEGYLRRERGTVSYQRTLALPSDVDEESVQAIMENGVLRLTIAKKIEAMEKRRKVEVK
jgi:HSP20 family protein